MKAFYLSKFNWLGFALVVLPFLTDMHIFLGTQTVPEWVVALLGGIIWILRWFTTQPIAFRNV